MKSMALGAMNILVLIFSTTSEIMTYRRNNEFASQIIVFGSVNFYYLHFSDCLGSPKLQKVFHFPALDMPQ